MADEQRQAGIPVASPVPGALPVARRIPAPPANGSKSGQPVSGNRSLKKQPTISKTAAGPSLVSSNGQIPVIPPPIAGATVPVPAIGLPVAKAVAAGRLAVVGMPAIDTTLPPRNDVAQAAALQPGALQPGAQTPFSGIADPEHEEGMAERLRGMIGFLPGWLVSFILHTILLVVLAVFTLVPDSGNSILDLELGEQATISPEMIEFESILDLESEDELMSEELKEESLDSETLEKFDELDLGIEEPAPLSELDSLLASSLERTGGEDAFAPGEGARFFGTGVKGKDFVFVVDASSSMSNEYRWEVAITELTLAIEALTEDQRFVVFLYNSFTHTRTSQKPKLERATIGHKQEVYAWLGEMGPDGDTRPWEAVSMALKLEPDAIFLLSDGELRDPTVRLLRRANDQLAKKNEEIPVHTIFLGNGDGGPTMETIANENAGTFRKVDNW